MLSSLLWPIIIILSAFGVGLVTFAEAWPALRPVIALWFLLVCPGMAFIRLLQLKDSLANWTLGIALSLALDAIVPGIMIYAGVWSPDWALVVLMFLSVLGAALQVGVVTAKWLAPRKKTARVRRSRRVYRLPDPSMVKPRE